MIWIVAFVAGVVVGGVILALIVRAALNESIGRGMGW